MLAIGAGTVSLRWTVELAAAAGASDDEIVGVLLAIAPAVGHARVVGVAPHLGLALGYDFEGEEGTIVGWRPGERKGKEREERGKAGRGMRHAR